MFKTLKNLYRKSVDAVTAVGRKIKSYFSPAKTGLALGSTLAFVSASASAAVPASVTTAISDAVTDVGTVGGLVIGVVVIVFAFAMMRKPMNG